MAGHNHQYERFAPMNPSGQLDNARGIRHFVAGMGDASHYSFETIQPNSQARNSDTCGVLKLTLHASSYDWRFVPEAGKTYSDSSTTTVTDLPLIYSAIVKGESAAPSGLLSLAVRQWT